MNTTIETKRLIAKFMNYANDRPLADGLLKSLYNDWNSLMPVVEKIEDFFEINGNELEFQVVSYEDEVKVIAKHSDKEWETLVEISADGSGKKENTYKACVEFIKWYNQNK